MILVMAIDPATVLGWAYLDSSGRRVQGTFVTWREPRKGKPAKPEVLYKAGPKKGQVRSPAVPEVSPIDDGPKDMRLVRLWNWLCLLEKPKYLVIEGRTKSWAGSRSSSEANTVPDEIRAIVKLWALRNDVKFSLIEPADLKLFATGKSNAKKEEVTAAARARLGYEGDSGDEGDAAWLLAHAETFHSEMIPKAFQRNIPAVVRGQLVVVEKGKSKKTRKAKDGR